MNTKSTLNRKKNILRSIICALFAIYCIILPIIAICVYEANFGVRYHTPQQNTYKIKDFKDLQMRRSVFISNNTKIAGYKYSLSSSDSTNSTSTTLPKGLVIMAHGLGCGGQNYYTPLIYYFTTQGFLVFTYDARGNDNSDGKKLVDFLKELLI